MVAAISKDSCVWAETNAIYLLYGRSPSEWHRVFSQICLVAGACPPRHCLLCRAEFMAWRLRCRNMGNTERTKNFLVWSQFLRGSPQQNCFVSHSGLVESQNSVKYLFSGTWKDSSVLISWKRCTCKGCNSLPTL